MANENSQRPVKEIDGLLNNEFKSDIVFLVGLKAEKIFGHRIFLEVASDVFYAMFNHDDFSENKENIVKIPDIEPEIFLELLNFVYCKKAKVDIKNLVALYAAADKYLIPDLQAICLSSINVWNVLWILKENTDVYKYEEIKSKCLDLIDNSLFDVLKRAQLDFILQDDIRKFVEPNRHRFSEDDLCCFLDRWRDTTIKNLVKIDESLKTEMMPKTAQRIFLNYSKSSNTSVSYKNYPSNWVKFKSTKPITLIGLGVLNFDYSNIEIWTSSDRVECSSRLKKIERNSTTGQETSSFIEEYFFNRLKIQTTAEFEIRGTVISLNEIFISKYTACTTIECMAVHNSFVTHLIIESSD